MSLVAHALVSVDDLRVWLRMATYTYDEGQVMETVINSITDRFEEETGRHILNADRDTVERLDGFGAPHVNLSRFPVISVSELLALATDGSTSETFTVTGSAVYVTPTGRLIVQGQSDLPRGVANIKVTYKAGFATVPNEIRIAALQWGAELFRAWAKEREPIESISIGNQTTTFFNDSIPTKVQAVIERYRIPVGVA